MLLAPAAALVTLLSVGAAPPTAVTLTGPQTREINQPLHNGTWDLRGAVWDLRATSEDAVYPIRSESVSNALILGGRVRGPVPRAATRESWYEGDPGPRYGGEGVRLTLSDVSSNRVVVKNTWVSDIEDGFDPQAANASSTVVLNHVRGTRIRDDAVENEGSDGEQPASMTVRSSLFDGVFTAFASRPSGAESARNGSGPGAFKVLDSLVWVRPMPLGPEYVDESDVAEGRALEVGDGRYLGNYGFWKWSTEAPRRVVVRDTVFRLDLPSYSSQRGMQWPSGSYENVILVWTGPGAYAKAGPYKNALPAGVRVTKDLNVWTRAKRAWLRGDRTPIR